MRRLFHYAGYAEGASFLLLLGVAMPLKYLADMPEAVKYTGWAHGLLFMVYVSVATKLSFDENWPFPRLVGAFAASVLPFGPFVFDRVIAGEASGARRA